MNSELLDDVTRALPHAVGPEKSVLSSIFQDSQEWLPVALEYGTTPQHFYLPSNAVIFEWMVKTFESGMEIELVSFVQRLLDNGALERAGGPGNLTELYTYAPSPGHFRHHLQLIRDKFILRRQIQVCNIGIQSAYDSPGEALETLDELERGVLSIRECCEASAPQETLKQAAEEFLENLQRQIEGKTSEVGGLTTGFEELDRMSQGGMKPGDMFVVAARPSMGKTAFMMNVVEHVVFQLEKPALVFSVEMSLYQLVSRLIASRARFSMGQISRGCNPNKGDLMRIQRVAMETAIAKDRFAVDTREGITINQVRARARREKRDKNIQFIAIDYLQLMKSKSKQADGSREREIAEISAGIKGLAKELGIPIMVLAQLNRGPEGRTGKSVGVPRMSDLRESGSIEQDADMVGLLYRKSYYAASEEEREACAGWAQLDLAKNRNGETGQVPLTFIAELTRFESGQPVGDYTPKAEKKGRFQD
jgi:replicative DNA helicase